MSSSSDVLNTLMDLAGKELESAVENLTIANKALNEAEEKGGMLRGYRQDYQDNLTKLLEKGLAKEIHNNYQNFLKKLDQAISGQEEIIVSAQYKVKTEREIWQEAQRKKLSYEVLLKRKRKTAHHQAMKFDQKVMDEYAMRVKRTRPV